MYVKTTDVKSEMVPFSSRVADEQGAVQILFRIIDSGGDTFGPETWNIVLWICFKLTYITKDMLLTSSNNAHEHSAVAEMNETAILIVNGLSSVFARFPEQLSHLPLFSTILSKLFNYFASIDMVSEGVSVALWRNVALVANALCHAQCGRVNDKDLIWRIWNERLKVRNSSEPQQVSPEVFEIFLLAFFPVYEYSRPTLEGAQTAFHSLSIAAQYRFLPSYFSDKDHMAPIQRVVFDTLTKINAPQFTASLIQILVGFILLPLIELPPLIPHSGSTRLCSFEALSRNATKILPEYFDEEHIFQINADSVLVSKSLEALAFAITTKRKNIYQTAYKSLPLWEAATVAAQDILLCLDRYLEQHNIATSRDVFVSVQGLIETIISSDCRHLTRDELDSNAILHINAILIRLCARLPAEVEPPLDIALLALFLGSFSNWDELQTNRHLDSNLPVCGTVEPLKKCQRTKLAFVCFDSLVGFTSGKLDLFSPNIVGSSKMKTLALPYMQKRCEVAIRSFTLNQPLFGQRPLPKYVLESNKNLTLDSKRKHCIEVFKLLPSLGKTFEVLKLSRMHAVFCHRLGRPLT